jgi:hypothetical protein
VRHCAARGSPRLRAVRYRGGRTTRNAIVALQRPIAIRVRGLKARRVAGMCVPKTSSTSCDQAVFVDQAADVSPLSDAVLVEVCRFG